MNNLSILIYLFSVFISSMAHILLKKGSSSELKCSKFKKNIVVLSSYSVFVISAVITTIALGGVEYKFTVVLESFSFIFILLFSKIYLKESITKKKLIGNSLIILGIIIFIA